MRDMLSYRMSAPGKSKCASCKCVINTGTEVVRITKYRPQTDTHYTICLDCAHALGKEMVEASQHTDTEENDG